MTYGLLLKSRVLNKVFILYACGIQNEKPNQKILTNKKSF